MANENPWKVHSLAAIDEYLKVTIQYEMGNSEIVECMVVFENTTTYRLLSPTINKMDLQKSNLCSINVIKIKKGM